MIRKIMVPVRGDGKGDNVLRHAARLAHAHGAHIVITHCRPRSEDLMPYGVPLPVFVRDQLLKQSAIAADQEEAGLRDELVALAKELDLKETETPDGRCATVSFVEEVGRQIDIVTRHGRLADIVAVAQPDKARKLGANTLKAAIFSSGRPVMMCPDQAAPETVGAHIAVGWNGSLEVTRAVALGMPLLDRAEKVTILTSASEADAATADELESYLALRGIASSVVPFKRSGFVGKDLLALSANAGADLLLMGAYHDSYERESIFGGNTQVVVDQAAIPVVMVH